LQGLGIIDRIDPTIDITISRRVSIFQEALGVLWTLGIEFLDHDGMYLVFHFLDLLGRDGNSLGYHGYKLRTRLTLGAHWHRRVT
jgi:hypothetical protein